MATVITLDGTAITAYVQACEIMLGYSDPLQHVANVGTCTLTVLNDTRYFSPYNAASPFYASLLPYKSVTVVQDGTTLFSGWVQTIVPQAGQYGTRTCTIMATDYLGLLQAHLISLPLQEAQKAGYILKLITSAALRGTCATGTITLAAAPGNNDTVTIGSTVYTFKTTLTAPAVPYEVKISGSAGLAARNLAAAINTAGSEWAEDVYGEGTPKSTFVSAYYGGTEGATGGTTTIAPFEVNYADPIGSVSGVERRSAQSFKVAAGTLSEIQVNLGAKTGSPGTLTWEICEDFANAPGTVLQSAAFAPVASSTNIIAVADGIELQDNVTYWLVLRITTVPGGSNFWSWKYGPDNYSGGINAARIMPSAWTQYPQFDLFAEITTSVAGEASIALTALARGAWGNSVALAANGADITVSAATLEGGVDQPAGLIAFDDGQRTIDIAGDQWREDSTNALTAVADVVESEFGYFWSARDGTLTFEDQQLPFELANKAADLTLDNTHNVQDTALTAENVVNRVVVSYVPRGTTTTGVIARAQTALAVPGRWGAGVGSQNYQRWNSSEKITQAEGSRTFILPFIDVSTGRVSGAKSVELPLVAGTDYTIFDFEDGTGWDYTYGGRCKFSVAITGSGLEVHMTNTALGTLYVFGLQARGTLNIAYDWVNLTIDDEVSQDEYGRRVLAVTLPLQISGGAAFAEQVAYYLLRQYSTPQVRTLVVGFEGVSAVGATSIYDIDIGDVVSVTETQTGMAAARYWVIGIQYMLGAEQPPYTTFTLAPLDETGYLTLDDAAYGLLDENRLAM
jgi:hypothetical protein